MVDATPWIQPAYKLFQASSHPCEFLSGYHAVLGNWAMERLRIQALSSSCLALGDFYFENRKIALLLKLLFESLFLFYILTKAKMLSSFSYHLLRLMWGSGYEWRGMFALLVLLTQKQDPSRKRVIQPDQDVQVCGLFLVIHELLLPDSFSLCYFQPWAINIFFWHAFASMWHTFFGYASFLFSLSLFFDILHEHVVYLLWVDIFYFLFA